MDSTMSQSHQLNHQTSSLLMTDVDLIKKSYIFEEEMIQNKADVASFISELLCGVCNLILKNPVECKVCEKPICTECKAQWFLQNPNHCPFCRSNSQFDKVNRITRNLLAKIRFHCIHKSKGCNEICSYQDLFKHQDKCAVIIFKCSDCEFVGHIEDKPNHNCINFLKDQIF